MVPFPSVLHRATFEKRYKRFFADAVLDDGTKVTAHCPNTGSMATCMAPGAIIWLSYNNSPTRKLKWTWELTETTGGYIGVNTALPNKIVEDAIRAHLIPEVSGYSEVLREVKYSTNSRIDILLKDSNKKNSNKKDCYVEVKNTTLLVNDAVMFPDAVTERGQKHLRDLTEMVNQGHRSVIFFLVNRPEGGLFSPADHIDPVYGKLLREVTKQGVEVLAYRALHTLTGIHIGDSVRIEL